MFAYCLNNPIQRSDPRGDASIIPLPTLRDYYYMHRAVQYDIVENYGFGMEVYVVGPNGVGRLDLYDGTTNQYYEVKHSSAAAGELFDYQMSKYDSSYVTGWRFEEYSIEGNVTRGQKYISGFTTYSYWDIEYHSREDGVIVYNWYINKARYEAYVATVAVVVAAAVVYSALGYCGGPLRQPTYVAFAW